MQGRFAWGLGLAMVATSAVGQSADESAKAFISKHEARAKPLELEANIAWWNANVSGKDEDFERKKKAQDKVDAMLSDPVAFKELKSLKSEKINDPMVKRQIDVLFLMYVEKQVDPALLQKITEKANEIEKAFNVYRAKVDGKELTDGQVRRVLKESRRSEERKAVWEANKGVGAVVESNLRELVKLRNQVAKSVGYADFHQMQLSLAEQDQAEVIKLFDELDSLTRGPFLKLKGEIDQKLAQNVGVKIDELRPWHYHDPFFQETPAVYPADLDAVFAKVDILKLCRDFYKGIDLPIEDVLAKSDLYEKSGKSPHAFCTDIDREGDVRVLANIVPNERWMGTMLHELGHAVYSSKNMPRSLPYVIRSEAHILTTEGIAMMFERFSKSADWLTKMKVELKDPAGYAATARKMRQAQLLIFSRWCQVMLRFEKELYRDPDQPLNKLWWDLVESYQGQRRPDGRDSADYASKIHIVSAPCYYHNYMMGELFACQVHEAMVEALYPGTNPVTAVYIDDKRVGAFLRERVFSLGRSLNWRDLTVKATGKPLGAKAFAAEFGGN